MQLCGPGRVKGASGGIPTQSACAWVRVCVCDFDAVLEEVFLSARRPGHVLCPHA